jgi:translation initiation factor 2 alpha subunit (eIF-2alpha)
MAATKVTARRASTKPSRATGRKWSKHVNETSNALDLEVGVFRKESPRQIAISLKRSADRSRRRKADSYRSAMSMLVFYVNRAGKNLSASRRRVLEAAKNELRAVYGRA